MFNVAIFDSLSKKQFQIDIALRYSDCLSITGEEFEKRMVDEFKKLLKAINL